MRTMNLTQGPPNELAYVDVSSIVEDGDAVTFDYIAPLGHEAKGFIVLWRGTYHAYRNICPHWGVPLDHEGQFVLPEGKHIVCHVHGAKFDVETGKCVWGPAKNQSLEQLTVTVDADKMATVTYRRSLFGGPRRF